MSGQKNVFGSFCLLIILPLCVFAAALAAFLGYVDLQMPKHTIIMLAIMLVFALFFAPQNEYCQGVKLLKNKELFKENLNSYIKDHSVQLGFSSKANASFDEFFNEFLQELKPLNFGFIAGAVFPMLGILGTFISIAVSMPDFSSADAAGLELEISKLLGGIATAFYVSIYGIFLSIWWMFAARIGKGKIAKFYAQTSNAYKSQFYSASDLERFYYEQLREQNERAQAVFNLLADADFFQKLKHLHDEKFHTFSRLLAHYENMFKAQADFCQKSLEVSSDNYNSCSKTLKEFLESQENILSDFKQSTKELSQKLFELKEVYEDEKDFQSLQNLKDDINELNAEAKDLLEKINSRE